MISIKERILRDNLLLHQVFPVNLAKYSYHLKNYGRTSTSKKEKSTRTIKSENKNRMADISVLNSEPIDESNVRVEFKSNIKNGAISVLFRSSFSREKMNKKEWEKLWEVQLNSHS